MNVAQRLGDKFIQVAKTNEKRIAVTSFEDEGVRQSYTYAELLGASQNIASMLLQVQHSSSEGGQIRCVSDVLTGLLAWPGVHTIASILGILCKGAYFYFSPDYTSEECKNYVQRTSMQFIIVEESVVNKINSIDYEILRTLYIFQKKFLYVKLNTKVSEENSHLDNGNIENLAYVIPTSGTTGVPKIVYVPHSCIQPNIVDFSRIFRVQKEDVIFCASPLTFDPSVVDIFVGLENGAELVTVPPHLLCRPKCVLEILCSCCTTILQATPSLMFSLGVQNLKDKLLCPKSPLRILALGGEMCPSIDTLITWVSPGCTTRIFNLYGVTEVSCWASVQEICLFTSTTVTSNIPAVNAGIDIKGNSIKTKDVSEKLKNPSVSFDPNLKKCPTEKWVSIGMPLTDTVLKVRNSTDGSEIFYGRGDLWISSETRYCWIAEGSEKEHSGHKRSRWISKNVDRSQNGQVTFSYTSENKDSGQNSDLKVKSEYAVKTGDVGLIRGGKIFALGRTDSVVKRNGKRISLSEINLTCQTHTQVTNCCSLAVAKKIILFIVPKIQSSHVSSEIYQFLKKNLVSWKLPDEVISLAKLPHSMNGKVDMKKLKIMYKTREMNILKGLTKEENMDEKDESLPKNCGCKSVKKVVHSLLSPYLNEYTQYSSKNFLELGGQSLEAVSFVNQVEQKLGCVISVLLDKLLHSPLNEVIDLIEKSYHDKEKADKSCLCNDCEPTCAQCCNIDMKNHCLEKKHSLEDSTKNHNSRKRTKYCSHSSNSDSSSSSSSSSYTHVSRRGQVQIGRLEISLQSFPSCLQLLWKYDTNKCIDSSPLLVHRNNCTSLIFVGSHSHRFICVKETGEEKWSLKLGDRIESSPCVSSDGTCVYIGCYDGYLYCISIEKGNILWKFKTGGEVKSSPIVDPHSGFVYFGSHDQYLYCVGCDGVLVWRCRISLGSIFASPILVNESVIVGTLDGIVASLTKETGCIKWKENIGKPLFSSPAAALCGVLFGCVDGCLYCMSYEGNSLWHFQTEGPIFSSPFVNKAFGKEIIAIGSHDSKTYILDSDGDLLMEIKGKSPIYSTPFMYNFVTDTFHSLMVITCETAGRITMNKLYYASTVNNYVTEAGSSLQTSIVAEYKFPGEVFSSPIFYNSKVYIGCRDDFLYCFKTSS
ncbi:aminoadipate-semialdehyde dehydrogenase [Oratosquilla oratoria]|uniref:aminoadipate-semialdehyde dehydrogenase n=1 Tax=Oratosquilla oratoria TaxID=337810 RepID=UPI003F767CA6